jgi:diadenosine hexaphosphate hydrolase (ATP-forming)
VRKEVSAGGLVYRAGKVLLVKVKNLKGEVVWTFPKGHLEKGETDKDAAIREVLEETGWQCKPKGRRLMEAKYFFTRKNGELVDKRVRWFEMEALAKTGVPDADEVLATKWALASSVERILKYPSDKQLIKVYLERIADA